MANIPTATGLAALRESQDLFPKQQKVLDFDLNAAYEFLATEKDLNAEQIADQIAKTLGRRANFDTDAALEAGFTPEQVITKLTGVEESGLKAFGQEFGKSVVEGGITSAVGLGAAKGAAALGLAAGAVSPLGLAIGAGAGLLALMSGLPEDVSETIFGEDRQLLPSDRPFREAGTTAGFVTGIAAPTSSLMKAAPVDTINLYGSQVLKNLAEQTGRGAISRSALKGGSTVLSAVEKQIARSGRLARDLPTSKKAALVAGQTAGMGAAAGLAEELFPQNPYARFAAEAFAPTKTVEAGVVGGATALGSLAKAVRSPRATFEQTVEGVKGLAQSSKDIFRRKGLNQAATDLQDAFKSLYLDDAGVLNEEAYARGVSDLIESLNQKAQLPEAKDLSISALLGDPILAIFEKNLGPEFQGKAQEGVTRALESLTIGVKGLTQSSNPEIVELATKAYKELFEKVLTQGIDRRATNAAQATDQLLQRKKLDPTKEADATDMAEIVQEGSRNIIKGIQQSLGIARDSERQLYDRVNRTVKVSAPNVVERFMRMQDENDTAFRISSNAVGKLDKEIKDSLKDFGAQIVPEADEAMARQLTRLENTIDTKRNRFDDIAATNRPAKEEFDRLMGRRTEGSEAYSRRLDRINEGFGANKKSDNAMGIELDSRTRTGVKNLAINNIQKLRKMDELKSLRTGVTDEALEATDVSLGRLMNFRTQLLSLVRQAPDEQRRYKAIYGELADAVLDDYELALQQSALKRNQKAGSDLQDAVTFSRALNDVFTRTLVGDLLTTQTTGARVVHPDLVAQEILMGTPQESKVKLDQLNAALNFLRPGGTGQELNLTGSLPQRVISEREDFGRGMGISVPLREAAEAPVASFNEGMERYLRTILEKEANILKVEGERRTINPDALANYFNTPEGMKAAQVLDLPVFSALKADLRDANKASGLFEGLVERKGVLSKSLQEQKILARFMGVDNPAEEFSRIFLSTKPIRELKQLNKELDLLAKTDPDTALSYRQAMQDAVFANIISRSENPALREVDGVTPIDFKKMEQILYRTNEADGFSKFPAGSKLANILSSEEVNLFKPETADALKDFVERAKRIQLSQEDISKVDPDESLLFQELINSYLTLRVSSQLTSATGGGASIQAQSAANKIRQHVGDLPNVARNKVLQEALGPGAAHIPSSNAAFLPNLLRRGASLGDQQRFGQLLTDYVASQYYGRPARAALLAAERERQQEPIPPSQQRVSPPIPVPEAPAPMAELSIPQGMQATPPPPPPGPQMASQRQQYAQMFPFDTASDVIRQQGGIGSLMP